MRANRVSAYVFAVAASLAGCAGGGSGEIQYSGGYSGQVAVASPDLVEIEPGVQVIADADEPLFYSDGSYWLYRDGYWMRSDDYRGGFAQVQLSYVPESVRVIQRPQAYVHYRRNHPREYEARRQEMQRRSPAQRPRTDVYRAGPSQGVPSQPAPDTWQRNEADRNRNDADRNRNDADRNRNDADRSRMNGGFDRDRPVAQPGVIPVPTESNPTPPVTSPNDVHGTPMPPRQAPPVPPQQGQRPDRNNGSTIGGEDRSDRRPMAPGEDHGRSATPSGDRDNRGNDRSDMNRGNDRSDMNRGNDRSDMNRGNDRSDSDRHAAPSPGQAGRPSPQPQAPSTEPSRDDRNNSGADRSNDRGNDRGDMNRGNGRNNDMGRGDEMNDSNRNRGNSASTPAQQKREERDNRDKNDRDNKNNKKHDR